ncbi:MAG: hypothetical protein QM778_03860 [Myxococcales bacterium]
MNEDRLAPRGSFGTALIQAPTVSTGIELEDRPVSQNPAEVLASLMDFPGSVALAELLAEPLPQGEPHPQSTALGERLLEDVRARLDALEPMALKPLSGRRAPTLLAPHEYLDALRRHGFVSAPATAERSAEPRGEPGDDSAATMASAGSEGTAGPSPCLEPGARPQAFKALVDELGLPFASALGTSLRQAQSHIATLRWEIAHDIRALGPTADRLERIDAALTRAMQGKMGELLDRMEYAAQLTFERACTHALMELPAEFGETELAEWSEENGWLGRYRERCIRMTKALFGHMRRGLEGLLRAATHGEDT